MRDFLTIVAIAAALLVFAIWVELRERPRSP